METKRMAPAAVIIAGGQGKRLRPLTATTPKPLLPVLGKPLLFHILKRLERMGVTDAYVMTGYLAEQIEAALQSYGGTLKPICIREEQPMGSAGCLSLIPGAEQWQECLVVSGDAYFEFDLWQAVELRRDKDCAAVLCLAAVEDPRGLGLLQCDKDGRILEFVEKPTWSGVRGDLANTGIYVLGEQAIRHAICAVQPLDFGGDVFPSLLQKGIALYGARVTGHWCDVGTPEAYRLCNMRLSGQSTVMGSGVKLATTASVAKSVLMDGVQVGAGATVTEAVIAENAIIGQGVTISQGAVVGASAVIGDRSRIGRGVLLPPGTIVASRSVLSADLSMQDSGSFCEGRLLLRPEDLYRCGHRAGRALAACVGEGERIGLMRPGKKGRGEFHRGFFEGILAGGADLYDLGWGFASKASFAASRLGCAYTVLLQENQDCAELYVYDGDGLYPDARFERRFSDLAGELPAETGRHGEVILCKELDLLYCTALCADNDTDLHGLSVQVHPTESGACELLGKALRRRGATLSERGDLILYPDESGCRVRAEVCGMRVGYWQLYTVLALEQVKRDGIVFLPYCCPEYIKRSVHSAGGNAVYYTMYPANDGERHIRSRLARQQPFATDGLFAAMRFAALVASGKLRAPYLAGICEAVTVLEEDIPVPLRDKLQLVLRHRQNFDGEGLLRKYKEGSVRLRACEDARFHLMAEAADDLDAQLLVERIKKEICHSDV